MRRFFGIIAIIGIVLPSLTSCRAISNFLRNDEVIAEVGAERLYRSEIDALMPKGLNPDDSLRMAMQYINAWATDQVYLAIAEEQLSKSEKDVSRELEEYRKSLLKYRYEHLYVNERLDTAVTDEAIEEYYLSHRETFRLTRPVVKARYLRIHTDSPMFETIRKKMDSQNPNDLLDADSLAFSSAIKFTSWNDQWLDVIVLAREFGVSHESLMSMMKGGWIRQEDTTGVTDIAFVAEMIKSGDIAPMEYSSPQIKDIIISARKHSLLLTLEQDLLMDARENGQFVIY